MISWQIVKTSKFPWTGCCLVFHKKHRGPYKPFFWLNLTNWLTFDQSLSIRSDIHSRACFFIRRDKSIKLNYPKPLSFNKLTAIYTTLDNRHLFKQCGKTRDSRRILCVTYSSHSLNHRKCVCACVKWRSVAAYCKENFTHNILHQNSTAVKIIARLL